MRRGNRYGSGWIGTARLLVPVPARGSASGVAQSRVTEHRSCVLQTAGSCCSCPLTHPRTTFSPDAPAIGVPVRSLKSQAMLARRGSRRRRSAQAVADRGQGRSKREPGSDDNRSGDKKALSETSEGDGSRTSGRIRKARLSQDRLLTPLCIDSTLTSIQNRPPLSN